jgi:hypothetical protein
MIINGDSLESQDLSTGKGLEILAKLRKKLIEEFSSNSLAKESEELYYHIERTLLTALEDHYGQIKKEQTSNRGSISKSERGAN